MNEQRLEILFQKFLNKTATKDEKREFFELIKEPGTDALLNVLSERYSVKEDTLFKLSDEAFLQILDAILSTEKPRNARVFDIQTFIYSWKSYAAAVVLFILAGTIFSILNRPKKNEVAVHGNQLIKDAMPGRTGAILSLSNGKTFLLDTTRNGKITDGFVKSSDAIVIGNSGIEYATLTTPFGRQEQITLSDGTKVWLNAGSSLHFPTVFSGKERKVQITGEAYFEVAHDLKKPFIVNAGSEEIMVLGTHFNINSYSDEKTIKTTLLEGMVKVNNKTILKPGEQYSNGNISKVDTEIAVGWVFGYFKFYHSDIQSVMRQISRWYEVDVKFEGRITTELFGGEIQRTLKLSELLDILTKTGIHYTLDGKTLTIRP